MRSTPDAETEEPYRCSTLSRAVSQITQWLAGDIAYDYPGYTARPPERCVLNVAGSRESKADGIQLLVTAIMIDVLRQVNPDCHRFFSMAG